MTHLFRCCQVKNNFFSECSFFSVCWHFQRVRDKIGCALPKKDVFIKNSPTFIKTLLLDVFGSRGGASGNFINVFDTEKVTDLVNPFLSEMTRPREGNGGWLEIWHFSGVLKWLYVAKGGHFILLDISVSFHFHFARKICTTMRKVTLSVIYSCVQWFEKVITSKI